MTTQAQQTYADMRQKLDVHIRGLFPVEGNQHRLVLRDLDFGPQQPADDYSQQKKARMTGADVSTPVKAKFELQDLKGHVVDRATMKIISLPALTNRGSYIVGGGEYSFPAQKRLKPGPYTRRGVDGRPSTFFNMGHGRNFKLAISDRGHFQFQVDTTTDIPLIQVLQILGLGTSEMERAWGPDVFVKNQERGARQPLSATRQKLWDKLTYGRDAPEHGVTDADVREVFASMSMDPKNVKVLLGHEFSSPTGAAILMASKKLLGVSRGTTEEDDRDSLIHNDILDLSDYVVERFNDKNFRGKIKQSIRFRVDRKDKVRDVVNADTFQRPVSSMFTETQLARGPMQTNPLSTLSDYSAITVQGEGGIQESNAITAGVRAMNPSHIGFLDPAHTPEGASVGTTLHFAAGARKRGKDIVTMVLDTKTGKVVEKTPLELWGEYVGFPEALGKDGKLKKGPVSAIRYGNVSMHVGPRYVHTSTSKMMDINTATIPFLSHNNGARVMLASKLSSQAKPLVGAESPMVLAGLDDGRAVEDVIGKHFSIRSPLAGKVEKITEDYIQVAGTKVSIPNHLPLNNNNFETATPIVKVGDVVKKDALLADTLHTRNGSLAAGKNLRVAYVPYKGLNVEDGVVISEAASKKMTSRHLTKKDFGYDAETILDIKKFQSYFPGRLTTDEVKKLDDRGVIKKGQTVEPGDTLVAALKPRRMGTESQRLARVSKILARDNRAEELTWDKDMVGVVKDVSDNGRAIIVYVYTEEPMRVGDKIVGRYGNKGVVGHILPDKDMPRNEDGKAMDLLLNPNGVVSRMNLGQIFETTVSRVAEKTGKPVTAPPFGASGVQELLKKHGVKDHESLYDPTEDVKIPGVLTGKQYIYKLEHQATKKLSARSGGVGEEYTADRQPTSGKHGGRAIGHMELYGLLAHGATKNVEEMYGFKSDFNPDAWRAVEEGRPLPPPKPSHVQEKFTAMLRGMGVETIQDKDSVQLAPLLDADTKKLSNGSIKNFRLLRGKDLREEKDGLFDPKTTGGVDGDKWSHIDLAQPMPHPTYEKAILSLLHMKKSEFDRIMREGGGGLKIKKMLSGINVTGRIKAVKSIISTKSGSELNALHKELRFLLAMKETGKKPEDYVVKKLPILPPKFRPIYSMADGSLNISDINFHYQATAQVNDQLKKLKGPEYAGQRKKLEGELYKSMAGVMGVGKGIVERRDPPKGLAEMIGGRGSPKTGFAHKRLLKRRQDVSATNVITPNPKLGIDELGVPEATAWNIFKPLIIKELRVMGLTPLQAQDAIDKRTEQARRALAVVVKSRHVIINRAPSLHKFSILAMKPKIVPGYAMEVPPTILGGLNADFDGNCVVGPSKIVLTFKNINRILMSVNDIEEDYGMKFSKDTKIMARDDDGLTIEMAIQDVPIDPESGAKDKNGAMVYKVPDGLSVASFDGVHGIMSPATLLTIEDNCPVAKVTTKRGYSVTASTNESLCVFDHNTGIVKDASPEDSIGAMSPILSRSIIFGTEKDWDWGWMTGAYVSDGFFTGRWKAGVGYTKLDDVKRERFASIIDGHQTGNYRRTTFRRTEQGPGDYGPNSTKDHFYGLDNDLKDYFETCYRDKKEWEDGKRASLFKKLPDTGTWSEDALWGLLNGLLDGDGSISISNTKKRPQALVTFSTSSSQLAEDVIKLAGRLGIRATKTTSKKSGRHDAYVINLSIVDVAKREHKFMPMSESAKTAMEHLRATPPTKDDLDLVPVPTWVAKLCSSKAGPCNEFHGSVATIRSKTRPYFRVSRPLAMKVAVALQDNDDAGEWCRMVKNTDVKWDVITNVEILGEERVYDLTVPDTKVFAVNDGLVVWDTFGVHVPISEAANREAEKMLPSHNLYKPGTGKLMHGLEHEYVLGLFKITRPGGRPRSKMFGNKAQVLSLLQSRKIPPNQPIGIRGIGSTTPGRVLINEVLPNDIRDYSLIWSDKAISTKLKEVDKKHGRKTFATVLQKLSEIGRHYAYVTGSSLLLSDLQTMSKQKNMAFAQADKRAHALRLRGAGDDEIAKLYMTVSNDLQKKVVLGKNKSGATNNLNDMMVAGARGNPLQVRQMISNVGVLQDHNNKALPSPVKSSYAEGLNTSEFFQHMYGNRKGMIDRSQSVRDPGALTKQVIVSAAADRIVTRDCGTHGGVMSVGRDAVGRCLAEPVPGVGKRNEIVDAKIVRLSKNRPLKVRSVLTCTAAAGVCSMCHGIDEEGRLPAVGDFVGIKSTQALTEPTTQLAMKTFHSGGVAESGSDTNLTSGFERVRQLFVMPNSLKNKAVLAEVGGGITSINKRPSGGWIVTVAGKAHVIKDSRRTVVVKPGQTVAAGDKLTDGNVAPQDVLKIKGHRAMQLQLTNDIHDVYAQGGIDIEKKTIEMPVRMLTNTIRVIDSGDHPSLVTGDYTQLSSVRDWNARRGAGKKPVKFVHELPGSEYLSHRQTGDWTRRLAHNRIKGMLTEVPAQAQKNPMHGASPFAALIYNNGAIKTPGSDDNG